MPKNAPFIESAIIDCLGKYRILQMILNLLFHETIPFGSVKRDLAVLINPLTILRYICP